MIGLINKSLNLYAFLQLDDHINCDIQVLSATERETLFKKDNTYILWTKEIYAILSIEILEKYKDFQRLFELEKNENFLPLHQPWDHKIKLEEGKQSGKYAIYPLLDFKLEILREYFNENIRHGLIQELQLLTNYLVLFAPKAGEELRMCVDYQ